MEKTRIVQTTCAYCGVGCGVDISQPEDSLGRYIDGVGSTTLTGTKAHPANFGRLCVKGTNLLATTSLEGRLLTPEIKGEQVSWQDAYAYVAAKFQAIIDAHGSDAVAFYVSGQLLTEDYYVANKLMKGYIGSANIDTNSRLCMSSAVTAYKRAFGEDVVPTCYDDLEATDLLILVGSNAAWTHPVLYQRIEYAKKINPALKIIVLDPRKTATSVLADIHLPLRPGSDAGFFNGLLRYMHQQDAIDEAYIARHTSGFENTLANANAWTVAEVSQFCQLDEHLLLEAYQLFCRAAKAITMYSMGINQSASGVDKCQAIINCHLATGKIGQPGCGPFSITGQPNAMGGREVGGLANQLAAHMEISNPQHREAVQAFWQSPTIANEEGLKAIDMFDAVHSGKIKAIWIMGTNPLVSLPDKNYVEQALKNCECVIVSDCVTQNDTLEFADVKLPAAPWGEKEGTVTNAERCISRQRQFALPAGEARPDWQIVCHVAKAMGFEGFNFTSPHEVFSEHAALTAVNNDGDRQLNLSGLAGLSKREYDQFTPKQWPISSDYPDGRKRLFRNGIFSTETHRANFIPVTPELPILTANNAGFILNSGRLRDQWHTMTRTGKASVLLEHSPFPQLDIHPYDAERLGLQTNELVKLRNHTGEALLTINISDAQRRNELFAPIHWSDSFASSAAINRLFPRITDPLSGQPQSKQAHVFLTKACFAHYGQLHSRQPSNIRGDFWQQVKTEYGFLTDFAFKQPIDDVLSWCQGQVAGSGEWSYRQASQTHYLCRWQACQLDTVIVIGKDRQTIDRAWFNYVFEQHQLELPILSALLSGRIDNQFAKGKTVCSCFNVDEKAIEDAIASGITTVEALGDKLQCGKNCGSCKPELQQLIERCPSG